jgi:hypothetical protein
MEGFAREQDIAGEVYAATSLVSSLCWGSCRCDPEAHGVLRHVQELARGSGRIDLQQVAEIWTMKVNFVLDDMDGAESTRRRLLALGPPRSPWIKSESLQAQAHLAANLGERWRQRALYAELLETLEADDPRRPQRWAARPRRSFTWRCSGWRARPPPSGSSGRRSPSKSERASRFATRRSATSPRARSWRCSSVQLPKAFSLLRSALDEHLSRTSFTTPLYPRLVLSEWLATAEPPRLDEALRVAEDAVEEAFQGGDFEQTRAMVLRSRVRFRRGEFWVARADGFAALDHAERLREQQHAMPLRLRYAQSLSFAYQSLAGALLLHRPAGDADSLDRAFQVMERLRARGLMETLLADVRTGHRVGMQPPTLAQVQARLDPREALLSFQIWRPEPMMDAPYREGSSWVTVVTRTRVEAFPVPNADVLEPQIRAWTGLLERRDGSDRAAGARLSKELLAASLAVLPPGTDRLVIVPDGPLHRVPFDALSGGPDMPYLAERFSVSIAPSASLWMRLRASPRLEAGRLLVLADPSGGSGAQAILRDSTGCSARWCMHGGRRRSRSRRSLQGASCGPARRPRRPS